MPVVLIILLLVVLTSIIISLYYIIKGKKEQNYQQLKQIQLAAAQQEARLNELNQQINESHTYLQQEQQRLADVMHAAAVATENMGAQTESIAKAISQFAEQFKKAKELEVEEHLKTLRILRDTALHDELVICEAEFENKCQEYELLAQQEQESLNALLIPIKQEVTEYLAKRDAIIAALKREQEIADNERFHQVHLNQDTLEDIEEIKRLLSKLNNRNFVSKVIWEVYLQEPTKEMINRVFGSGKVCGIYRITNINTQECYIGQGVDVGRRITEHIKGTLGIQSIADQAIHRAMAETGLTNWTFELLEECAKEDLNNREKFYINFYKSNEYGMNKTKGCS